MKRALEIITQGAVAGVISPVSFASGQVNAKWMYPVFKNSILVIRGSVGYIAIKIMAGNKRRPSLIFVKLSSLPILIITTHIILMIHGRPFTEQGGWWVLYALLILGLPISVILLIIGLIRMKFKEAKVKNG